MIFYDYGRRDGSFFRKKLLFAGPVPGWFIVERVGTMGAIFLRDMDDGLISKRLKERDQQVLNDLFDTHGPALYGVIYRMVHHEKAAEDILYDTFAAIWEQASTFDPDRMRCFTWMLVIARKQAKAYMGSSTPEGPERRQDREAGRASAAYSETATAEWLGQLPPEERDVMRSVVFAGHSPQEVARQLDVSVEFVNHRLRSALILLRKKFQSLS